MKTKNIFYTSAIVILAAANVFLFPNTRKVLSNEPSNNPAPKIENTNPKDSLSSSDRFKETLEKLRNLPGVLDSIKAAKKNDDVSIEDYSWLYNRDTNGQSSYIDSLLEVKAAKQKSTQVVDSTKDGEQKPEEKEGLWKKLFGKEDKEKNPHKRQK